MAIEQNVGFNHVEQPAEQLGDRFNELQDIIQIPHGPERLAELAHEFACVAWELLQRKEAGEIEIVSCDDSIIVDDEPDYESIDRFYGVLEAPEE